MIYFDNSATGGFKPYLAIQSAVYALNHLNANPSRSAHKLSVTAEEFVYKTRKALCEFFNAEEISRVIFTKNCTEAINLAIFGYVKAGDHVITTYADHNSVLRPLFHLEKEGIISLSVAYPEKEELTTDDILKAVNEKTSLIVLSPVSNVTGKFFDYTPLSKALKGTKIKLLIDGAQACGHIALDLSQGIDMLAVAGHKGMNAIQGVGALIFNKSVEIKPLIFGGSGSETFAPVPSSYPESLEAGTLNLPAICSLYEGTIHAGKNLKNTATTLLALTEFLIEKLKELNVKIYSAPNESGIVAFSSEKIDSINLSEILSDKYDIAVRGGFHCAPLLHKFLKTDEAGLLRVSLSPYNTKREITKFIFALKEIFAQR